MFSLSDFVRQQWKSVAGQPTSRVVAACLSITAFAAAIFFVGFGFLGNRSLDNQRNKIQFTDSSGITVVSRDTRDIFAARPDPDNDDTDRKMAIEILPEPQIVALSQPVPRLKPAAPLVTRRVVSKSIDMNAAWLAEERHYGFAEERDFTGGKTPLFTKYVSPFESLETDIADDLVILRSGESLYTALVRAGIRSTDADAAASSLSQEMNIRTLRPGAEFRIKRSFLAQTEFEEAALSLRSTPMKADALVSLRVAQDPVRRTFVKQDATGNFFAESEIAQTTLHYAAISGEITDSLFASAERAGAPREIVARLANMFLFDVDFQREIRKGDRFEAVYEVFYDEMGRPAGYGDVVFGKLSWLSQKREKGYYRFFDDGKSVWFDSEGKSARRLLMKTPIDGARITSGFGRRRHPVLGYTKSHKGVDFGARRGTPIMAAGDGTVERANVFGSYGKYVRIRHKSGYKTAYAHMNGFGKGIKKGARVRQGQIIGYVGTTGRSTGPHLHYEVLRHSKQINPMRIKVSTGKELKGDDLDEFRQERNWVNVLRVPQKPVVLAQK